MTRSFLLNRALPAFGVALVVLLATQVELPRPAPPPPPAPAILPAPPPAPDGEPRVLIIQVGRNDRGEGSFVTDTASLLTVRAEAQFDAASTEPIRWSVTPPTGFAIAGDSVLDGEQISVTLERPAGNPTAEGAPLSLMLTASAGDRIASLTLEQDPLDRLRQEYVDLQRRLVPVRSAFLDAETFAARYANRFPGWTHARLNFSINPATGERYPYILLDEALLAALAGAEELYGRIYVTSGFRNPYRQRIVHGEVEESHHQYGRAADLGVPIAASGVSTAHEWLGVARAALAGGGHWIEPMLACGVNTAGCHVHVDVRPAGARSQVVQLAGRVADRRGRALANARVDLAGMPTRTDSSGRFSLTHVLTPGAYSLEVADAGGALMSQVVSVHGAAQQLAVAFNPGAADRFRPRLAVRVLRHQGAQVLLAVTNEGAASARDVRCAAVAVAGGPGVIDVEPRLITVLPPGATIPVQVTLEPLQARATARFRLLATFADLRGREERVALAVGDTASQFASRGEKRQAAPPPAPETTPEPEAPSVLPSLDPGSLLPE